MSGRPKGSDNPNNEADRPNQEAERLAREAEANYRTLVENSPTGIFIVQDGRVVFMNPRLAELMGYSTEEVLGTPIMQYVHPEDVPRLGSYEKRRIAGEDVPSHYIGRGITKHGEIRTFEFRASVIAFEGAPAVLLNAVDITESQRIEDALLKSEEAYRSLVEQISDWVWQIDENMVFTYVSPRVRDLLGYEPDELIGKTPFDFMAPDFAKRLKEEFEPLAKHEAFSLLENPMIHRNGRVVWVEASAEPILDEQGAFRGYRGIDRDISVRKEAEAIVRASEEQYKFLFDNSPLPMWVFSLDSLAFLAVNEAMLRHYGYTREELIGESIMIIRTPEEADRLRKHIGTTLKTGLDIGGIWKHKKRDGTPIDVEITSHTLEWQGNPAVLILANDVTERLRADKAAKESRERLQAVMNNIPQFVFWKDRDSVYLGCNENFARAAGLESPEGIVGKTDYDLPWAETQADSYREWDRRVMDNDTSEYHIVESQLTAEDQLMIVDTNKVPMHDASGRVVGILGTYEDITDRIQSEQALTEAEAKYRSLVEETMVGVYLIQDNKFAYVNPRMVEIFGYDSPEEMIGMSPLDTVAPEDRPRVVENLRKRLEGEAKSVRYTFTGVRKDGMPIDIEVHGSLTAYRGRPAIIGSLIDITERKRYVAALQESEDRYRQLFEHSPDMVFLISVESGTFIAINPAVTRILGYAAYDVLGRTPGDISPEFQPDGERSMDRARKLLEDGRRQPEPQLFEWVHKCKDGNLLECEVSLVYYRFHGEDLVQAIVRDISERKHAEEARRKFERDVELQKRTFYRDTILSVTDGKLNICEYEDLEPFIVKAADEMEVNDYSQVAEARRFVEEFVEEHGIKGDRKDDFMVGVGEAITNAVKHGELGKVYIGADAECAWVVISDRGVGIESLILPRAVLLRGFSTKPSLGLGYSIMLEVSDRILLNTGERGTTVVLMKDLVAQDMTILAEYLPDTWDNVPG